MFYCEPCRKKHLWPMSIGHSYGRCEMCNTAAVYHDTPSSRLPAVDHVAEAIDSIKDTIKKRGANGD